MVAYTRRNGDEQQASAMLRHRSHLSDVAETQVLRVRNDQEMGVRFAHRRDRSV
jgi:hypothetical protein